MATITYDFGHGVGRDRGANGILNEEKVVRNYGQIVINDLKKAGHTCINCTPFNSNMTVSQSLVYRVNKANATNSVLHLCFHANAFNATAHGSEIEVASQNGEKYGVSILKELSKLGFTNRGVKTPNLYVIRHTKMIAILLEPFFVTSKSDCSLYNYVTMGHAISKGIINIIGSKIINNSPIQIQPKYDKVIVYNNNVDKATAVYYMYPILKIPTIHYSQLKKYPAKTYIAVGAVIHQLKKDKIKNVQPIVGRTRWDTMILALKFIHKL